MKSRKPLPLLVLLERMRAVQGRAAAAIAREERERMLWGFPHITRRRAA